MNRTLFSLQARAVFNIAVNHRRLTIVLSGDALAGTRFNNDEAVLARAESMFTEAEFMSDIGPCIDKALEDAAQSDWWYRFEKDYDDHDCPPEETEIAGDE